MKSTCFVSPNTNVQKPLKHMDSIRSVKNLNIVRMKILISENEPDKMDAMHRFQEKENVLDEKVRDVITGSDETFSCAHGINLSNQKSVNSFKLVVLPENEKIFTQ